MPDAVYLCDSNLFRHAGGIHILASFVVLREGAYTALDQIQFALEEIYCLQRRIPSPMKTISKRCCNGYAIGSTTSYLSELCGEFPSFQANKYKVVDGIELS